MKKTKTSSKLLAALLALVMALSLLPFSALAADEPTEPAVDGFYQISDAAGVASWDGVTSTEPELVDGVYQISDPEHLAWFRNMVNSDLIVATSGSNGTAITNNSTSSTRNAILLNDIDLGDHEWVPIGTYTTGNYSATAPVGFAGTFDGNGNTISGLSITTGANGSGLFGVLMGGTVKDLTVRGSIRGGQYTGGIVGYGNGNTTKYPNGATISNCVSYVDITATRMFGGIIGNLSGNVAPYSGVVEYCMNYGTITSSNSGDYIGGIAGSVSSNSTIGPVEIRYCGNEGNVSGGDSVGGVVGNGSVPVTGCYNAGNVLGSSANSNAGGIVGFTNNAYSNTITDCYNKGNVTGANRVGGIIGWLNNTTATSPASIENAYNTGTIAGTGTAVGAIIGEKNSATNGGRLVINTYYLEGTAAGGIGLNAHSEDEAEAKAAAEMQNSEFLNLLGEAFQGAGTANGGYPILIWQTAGVDYLAQAKAAKIAAINAVKAGLTEAQYTAESWAALMAAIASAIADVNAAESITEVDAIAIPDPGTILELIPAGQSVTVFISYQADDTGFVIAKQEFTVTADLAEQYGYADSFYSQKVSVLDAIVAAHIAIFGDDIGDINNAFAVGSSGWFENFMGNGTGFCNYFVNGELISSATDMELSAGDYLQLQSVQDTNYWSDSLSWFEYEGGRADAITVEEGRSFTLTLRGAESIAWQDPNNLVVSNISGASVVEVSVVDDALFNGESFGYFEDAIGTTDSDGTVTLSYTAPGTYVISAIRSSGSPLISPWLVITVVEEGTQPGVDKSALNALIAQAQSKDEDDYESGWSEFVAALGAAIAIAADDNATLAEVNAAINALNMAMNALVAKTGALPDWEDAMNAALAYILQTISTPGYRDEWAILALARSGYGNTDYYDGYFSRILGRLISEQGNKLNASMSTDNSRLVLALTALGVDASSAGGKDLVAPLLFDYDWVTRQGIHGAIYALLAINSAPYSADVSAIQALVDYILDGQINGGGWGMAGIETVEMTAMALQALAPYYSQPSVKAAVDDALDWMGTKTISDAENNAQVIVALSALGLDAENYVNALLAYFDGASGGFKHSDVGSVNLLATEQAAYALVAYDRFKNEQNALYDMSDAVKLVSDNVTPADVDKSALGTIISQAEALVAGNYTVASWGVFQNALTYAKAVIDDEYAAQGEVDAAVIGLETAISTLTPVDAVGPTPVYVWISVTDPGAGAGQTSVYYSRAQLELNNNETAYTLLLRTGLNIRISTSSAYNGVYVVSINGFGEFDDGPLSGWVFKVNGVLSTNSASSHRLQAGDVVEWVYTRDLGNDVGGSGFIPGTDSTTLTDEDTPLSEFDSWLNPFSDVNESDWFFEAVRFMNALGYMVGTENGFEPETTLSRAMVATLLWQLADRPEAGGNTFTDVPDGQYYTTAVSWAHEIGLVRGYGDGRFGPEDDITREQLITILFNYAGMLGVDTSSRADISNFADAGNISDWAREAISWAVAAGFVHGRTATALEPEGTATRAEAAALLMQFISAFVLD